MKIKRIIYLILIILQLLVIFNFSAENGSKSSGRSHKFINNIINVYKSVSKSKIDNKEIIKTIEYPIRKCAHFTIYFILGIFVILFFLTFDIKYRYLFSGLFVYICACLDEVHQLFVPGRSGKLLDTFVDLFGSCIAFLIIYLIRRKKTKNS